MSVGVYIMQVMGTNAKPREKLCEQEWCRIAARRGVAVVDLRIERKTKGRNGGGTSGKRVGSVNMRLMSR